MSGTDTFRAALNAFRKSSFVLIMPSLLLRLRSAYLLRDNGQNSRQVPSPPARALSRCAPLLAVRFPNPIDSIAHHRRRTPTATRHPSRLSFPDAGTPPCPPCCPARPWLADAAPRT